MLGRANSVTWVIVSVVATWADRSFAESGSRGDTARFTIGLAAGLGSGTSTTSTPGLNGAPAASVETTLSETQSGAFIGLLDLSGTSLMPNVGSSFWTGGGSPATEASGWRSASRAR